ncbi:hypothetical protein BS78_K110700 [Paspalum vaginatum]|uniref:Uncharacterized protein n=1 Tax=Paspalum vaginatum TaxID=158149 RepID=A0A9W8CD02_9POAL|nr:hypothetical protein BS78_K110700 [Paspalum vaginatum]
MSYPPSQSLETPSKRKGKQANSSSGPSKWHMSRSGSNQPESITFEVPSSQQRRPIKKAKGKGKKEETIKNKGSNLMVPFDSPAMGTRSKMVVPPSPAMATRSKRRLSL